MLPGAAPQIAESCAWCSLGVDIRVVAELVGAESGIRQ